MRTVKILLYSGILAMSAALPFLRFWEAEEAWNATTRVTALVPFSCCALVACPHDTLVHDDPCNTSTAC